MFATTDLSKLTKPELYRELTAQISGVVENETDPVANMANCAALIFHSVPKLNWVGFYLLKGGELVLGPFQGQVACVRIAFGRGVVGTAAEKRTTIRVADVNQFPGHIACDSASKSEIASDNFPDLAKTGFIIVVEAVQFRAIDVEDTEQVRIGAHQGNDDF